MPLVFGAAGEIPFPAEPAVTLFAERPMSERDDDILDFDFFDEPATVEQQPTQRVRMPRRRPSGSPPRPPIRPPQGFAPLFRLVLLIAFAIAIVVLLVFWVQSCQSSAKKSSY